jgi:cytochrome P450
MLVVTFRFRVTSPQVAPEIWRFVRQSYEAYQSPGWLGGHCAVSLSDPQELVEVEHWASRAAFDAWQSSPAHARYERLGAPLLAGPYQLELLRFEPPVQVLPTRTALADIPIAGTTIPRGSAVILMLASGSWDPARFGEPERFDPDRPDNEHLGFGSGIHYCYGAPLARLEAQIALTALARRLENPWLVRDPPPYRQSVTRRGPRHLLVDVDGVCD